MSSDIFGLRGRHQGSPEPLATNPLVVSDVEVTTPFSGLRLVEDGHQLITAIQGGDWCSGVMATVAGAADLIAAVIDPLATAVGMGVGWMLDHVWPLNDWLNVLTGDAGAVMAAAATWANVSTHMRATGDEMRRRLEALLHDMQSHTTNAYLRLSHDVLDHVALNADLAHVVSEGLKIASTIVQIVHDLVRDALGDIVGKFVSGATMEILTLGFGTPKLIADIMAMVAKWTARLGSAIEALLRAFSRFSGLMGKADDLMRAIGKVMELAGKPADLGSWAGHQSVREAFAPFKTPKVQPPHIRYTGIKDTEFYDDLVYQDPNRPAYRSDTVIDVTLPQQGGIGDCYLVSSLGAVAHQDPELLKGFVRLTHQGAIVYAPDGPIFVPKGLPTAPGVDAAHGDVFARSPDGSTAMGYIEKAFAQTHGGYHDIGHGAFPKEALEWITGREAIEVPTKTLDDNQLRALVSTGAPTVVTTRHLPEDSFDAIHGKDIHVYGSHAYTAVGVGTDGSILLHNPWGDQHPVPLHPSTFRHYFDLATLVREEPL